MRRYPDGDNHVDEIGIMGIDKQPDNITPFLTRFYTIGCGKKS